MKNAQVQIWRSELGNFDYRIEHRPGKANVAPDTFSTISSMTNEFSLSNIHKQLGHPGISRLSNFVRTKNLPFSVEDVKNVCESCQVCAEIKPRFYEKSKEKLKRQCAPGKQSVLILKVLWMDATSTYCL